VIGFRLPDTPLDYRNPVSDSGRRSRKAVGRSTFRKRHRRESPISAQIPDRCVDVGDLLHSRRINFPRSTYMRPLACGGGEGRGAATFPAAGLGVRRCRHPHWPAATSRPAEHRITSVLTARHAGCAIDKAPGECCPAVMWCMTAGLAPVADRPDRADLPALEESFSRSCPRRDDEMHDIGRLRYHGGRDSIISREGDTRAAPREVRDQFGRVVHGDTISSHVR
jgi:hypothetical protein